MKVGAMFPSKYLKSAEVEGRTYVLTIANIAFENVGEDQDDKPVLHFQGAQKGMVLNRTNAAVLEWLYGDETNNWIGKQIELFTEMTTYMGKPVLGLRLRGPNAPAATPSAAAPAPDPLAGAATPAPRGPGEQAAAVAQPTASHAPRTDLDDEIPF